MLIADDVILDPVEAVPDGVELDLSKMGLTVRSADWGDSSTEGTVIETNDGRVILVDRKPKYRTITLGLGVRADAEADLPTAAYRLQQKLGSAQERVSWLKRDPKVMGDFAGPLLYRISGPVSSSGLSKWQAGEPSDPTLTLVCDFAAYSTEEVESDEFSTGAGDRQLVYTLDPSTGTTRGLKRVQVTNDGEEDWRGLIWAEECRDYKPEDETAEPVYLAKNLTPLGAAEAKEVSGALVVQHTALTVGWITILSSEIAGVGHMTHRGTRRMWMRIYDPGSEAGDVQLRLLWRALGSSRWTENLIVPTPAVDEYALIDLGECRPQVAALGDERWEWQLSARAVSGSGAIRIRDIYPLPTEQFAVLTAPAEPQSADLHSEKSPGTVSSVELLGPIGSAAWTNPSNAKTSDNSRATRSLGPGENTYWLAASSFGFTLPEGAQLVRARAIVEGRASTGGLYTWESAGRSEFVIDGVSYEAEAVTGRGSPWPTSDTGRSFQLYAPSGVTSADLNASGFTYRIAFIQAGAPTGPTAEMDAITVHLYYTEAEDPNRICFASRSIELRSDGVHRQAPGEDDVWGPLVPDGTTLPYDPPGGLEERPSRGILIASEGDLDELADSTTSEITAKVLMRPAYHYAREAA